MTTKKQLKILFLGTDTDAARLLEGQLKNRDSFKVSSDYNIESNDAAHWSRLKEREKKYYHFLMRAKALGVVE